MKTPLVFHNHRGSTARVAKCSSAPLPLFPFLFFFFLEKSFLARKKALFVGSLARISLLLLGDVQRRRYTRAQKRAYTRAAPAACSVVGHETTPRQWSVLTKFVCRALHIRSMNSTVFSYLPLSSLTVRRIKLKQGVKSCVNGGIKCVSCFQSFSPSGAGAVFEWCVVTMPSRFVIGWFW